MKKNYIFIIIGLSAVITGFALGYAVSSTLSTLSEKTSEKTALNSELNSEFNSNQTNQINNNEMQQEENNSVNTNALMQGNALVLQTDSDKNYKNDVIVNSTDITSNTHFAEDELFEKSENSEADANENYYENYFEEISSNAVKADSDTKITYEYYYALDGITETKEEALPLFLLGSTEKDVEGLLGGWNLVKFTPEEIVVRKELEEYSDQHYIVGIYDGYIAVFFDDRQGNENGVPVKISSNSDRQIKQVTNRSVSALTETEILKLEQGIHILGDDALFQILQDYGS